MAQYSQTAADLATLGFSADKPPAPQRDLEKQLKRARGRAVSAARKLDGGDASGNANTKGAHGTASHERLTAVNAAYDRLKQDASLAQNLTAHRQRLAGQRRGELAARRTARQAEAARLAEAQNAEAERQKAHQARIDAARLAEAQRQAQEAAALKARAEEQAKAAARAAAAQKAAETRKANQERAAAEAQRQEALARERDNGYFATALQQAHQPAGTKFDKATDDPHDKTASYRTAILRAFEKGRRQDALSFLESSQEGFFSFAKLSAPRQAAVMQAWDARAQAKIAAELPTLNEERTRLQAALAAQIDPLRATVQAQELNQKAAQRSAALYGELRRPLETCFESLNQAFAARDREAQDAAQRTKLLDTARQQQNAREAAATAPGGHLIDQLGAIEKLVLANSKNQGEGRYAWSKVRETLAHGSNDAATIAKAKAWLDPKKLAPGNILGLGAKQERAGIMQAQEKLAALAPTILGIADYSVKSDVIHSSRATFDDQITRGTADIAKTEAVHRKLAFAANRALVEASRRAGAVYRKEAKDAFGPFSRRGNAATTGDQRLSTAAEIATVLTPTQLALLQTIEQGKTPKLTQAARAAVRHGHETGSKLLSEAVKIGEKNASLYGELSGNQQKLRDLTAAQASLAEVKVTEPYQLRYLQERITAAQRFAPKPPPAETPAADAGKAAPSTDARSRPAATHTMRQGM